MLGKFQHHVRHNVVAYLALFVAMGGTSYAVATVGPDDIQDDAVQAKHVADDAVRSYHIEDDELKDHDILDGEVKAPEIADGAVGGAELENNGVKGADVDESSLRFACPSGTRLSGGACIEETTRNADLEWPAAADLCAAFGRRLPTLAELQRFRQLSGITLDSGREWSSNIYVFTRAGTSEDTFVAAAVLDDAGEFTNGVIVGDSFGDLDDAEGQDHEFRCVAEKP